MLCNEARCNFANDLRFQRFRGLSLGPWPWLWGIHCLYLLPICSRIQQQYMQQGKFTSKACSVLRHTDRCFLAFRSTRSVINQNWPAISSLVVLRIASTNLNDYETCRIRQTQSTADHRQTQGPLTNGGLVTRTA